MDALNPEAHDRWAKLSWNAVEEMLKEFSFTETAASVIVDGMKNMAVEVGSINTLVFVIEVYNVLAENEDEDLKWARRFPEKKSG